MRPTLASEIISPREKVSVINSELFSLFEAGSLFGLPNDIFTAIVEMLNDEKVPGIPMAKTFLESIAFSSHHFTKEIK